MPFKLIDVKLESSIAVIAFNDPEKRNALSLPMFNELDAALQKVAADSTIAVVILRGEGRVFCAGFDLAAVVADPQLLEPFILRLSDLNRVLRRLPQVVVAAVHGAAIAGGCAILSACDFVFASRDAMFGYPVHRIGISPAVTIPTLQHAVGNGAARSLLMSGELISAAEAYRVGLVTHLSESAEPLFNDAMDFVLALSKKGQHALRITKKWLNELDGSLDDQRFARPAAASAQAANSYESRRLLATWSVKMSQPS